LVNNCPRAAAVSLFVEDGQWNRLENSCTNRGSLGVEEFNAAYYLQTLVALPYPQKLWLMQYRCDFVALPYRQKLWFMLYRL
jgi:hypothetical protein